MPTPAQAPSNTAAVSLPPLVVALEPDGAGRQQYSNPDGTIPVDIPKVSNLTVVAKTTNTVTLGWGFSADTHDNFTISRWRAGVDTSWVILGTVADTARGYKDTGLLPGKEVGYRVTACSATGCGPSSEVWTFTYADTGGDTDLSQIYYYEDFEGGTPGQRIPEFTKITTTQATCYDGDAYAGTKCAVNTILQGDSGWTRWGFLHSWKEHPLVEGDQVWCRFAFKCPPDFSWQSTVGVPAQFGGSSLKFWRLRGRVTEYVPGYEGEDQGAGCCDTHIIGTGSQNSPYGCMGFRTSTEWQSQRAPDSWPPLYDDDYFNGWDYSFTDPFDCREWHMVEIAYVIGDPQVAGGIASIKMWLDGRYLGENRNSQTAVPHDAHKGGDVVGGVRDEMLLSTYWNGEAPKDNTWYFDQWAVAIKCASTGRDDTPHLSIDSEGNKFIGLTTSSGGA